jgi:hypothetical protein
MEGLARRDRVRLVIIACGKSKIWDKHPSAGPTPAKDVYTGWHFAADRRDAEKLGYDDWMILSAKYGFIRPDSIIPEAYNVTFSDRSTNPISVQDLGKQVKEQRLDRYDEVTVFGGKAYVGRVRESFYGTNTRVEPYFANYRTGKRAMEIDTRASRTTVAEPAKSKVVVSDKPAEPQAIGVEPRPTGIPNSEVFLRVLNEVLSSSKGPYVDVTARDLHKLAGGRSGKDSRMPTCCNVMIKAMRDGDTKLHKPPKERGPKLKIQYRLPR